MGGSNSGRHSGSLNGGFTARHSGSFSGGAGAAATHHNGATFSHRHLSGGGANVGANLGHGGTTAGAGVAHHHGGINASVGHHRGVNSALNHYPRWNWNHGGRHHSVFFFSPFFGGFGFPFLGLGPYGYGYRVGYPYYGNCYQRVFPYYGYGGLGYYGYGFSPYSYGNYSYVTGPPVATPAQPTTQLAAAGGQFAQQGEVEFKARNYKAAIQSWRHALVDDPQNGVLVLMLAQALFADGQFDEAAGAVQQGLAMLPEEQWNVVVANYKELYSSSSDYAAQLKTLEKAVKGEADNPANLFLLGYHYGYLGYKEHAVRKLDEVVRLAPQDELAKRLRGVMLGEPPTLGAEGVSTAPAEPAASAAP
ncbi:MAG: tetratricopeptide repeat protein [Pirellulales bacterium]|nr:tetratricopeptide repeat protein [Pirellulales bacterium]